MALYLVDGHALAFRSYYAFIRQPLVNSKGEETSAVFGFLNTILNLLATRQPEHLAVVFDAPGKTFRHDKYAEYKANRAETPESLAAQMPVIMAALEAMNVRTYSLEGYEADDLIATIARRLERDVPVKVVSGDKDLLQLVTERVHVIRPGKVNTLENEVDPDGLEEAMGLEAGQIVDYLALMGDSTDNVPGVRGIGQKTALKLLREHGTLDALYGALEVVEPKSVRSKLEAGRESAILSRELVELDDDVPFSFGLDDMKVGDIRTPAFRSLLADLEFERISKQVFREGDWGIDREESSDEPGRPASTVEEVAPAAGEETGDCTYELVDTPGRLAELAGELARSPGFAVDVETSAIDPMRATLAGIALSTAPGIAHYVPVMSTIASSGPGLIPDEKAPGLPPERVREALAPVFANPEVAKIGQNIKYDAIVLERAGLPLEGIAFDTMIASYCLDPSRRSHGLDALAMEFCGHEMIPFKSLFEARSRDKDIRRVPLDRVTDYACEDADYTLRLQRVFAPLVDASQVRSLFHDVEMPLQDVLRRMETTGVRVDSGFLASLSKRYAASIGELEGRIYESVGQRFNLNSTQQLREVLFDRLGLKPRRKTKTGYSTDVDVLTTLAEQHEAPRLLLEYRQLVKLRSTYVDALPKLVNPETGRVHTSYNQAVTSTGRLSSSDPNLQNIPIRTREGREIRKAFVSSGPGWVLLDADYSQIELRILAHLSGDRDLLSAFRDDEDIHRLTAARILGVSPDRVSEDMRSRAKAVNFGIVYGMGARGLAQSLEIDVAEAKRFIDDYFESYPGVKRFIDETIERARREKAVGTILGRMRQLPDISSSNGRARSFSERIAVNTPVQGSAADIIKLAMLKVDSTIRERGLRAKMILQVHDELLFDLPAEELGEMRAIVKDCMENAMSLDVPLKVDMGEGTDWLQAH
jgi:DNA polymerase-1